MSMASTATTVKFRGEEDVDISEACRAVFVDLQAGLNNIECGILELSMAPDQLESFIEAFAAHQTICDNVDTLSLLFKELKGISRDVCGPCPSSQKQALAEWKANDKRQKEDAKRDAEALKQVPVQE